MRERVSRKTLVAILRRRGYKVGLGPFNISACLYEKSINSRWRFHLKIEGQEVFGPDVEVDLHRDILRNHRGNPRNHPVIIEDRGIHEEFLAIQTDIQTVNTKP